jgi:two-component system sensor histidine kinase ChvG
MTALPRLTGGSDRKNDVLLGEDWITPDAEVAARARPRLFGLRQSPLARKIILFNLLALVILVTGVLFLNPFRDGVVVQREQGLVTQAALSAQVLAAGLPDAVSLPARAEAVMASMPVGPGVTALVTNARGVTLTQVTGAADPALAPPRSTVITDFLNAIWTGVSRLVALGDDNPPMPDQAEITSELVARALAGETAATTLQGAGGTVFAVAAPVVHGGAVIGALALTSPEGEIDALVRHEREQVLQMFIIALLVSIGLSLVLASTIANPLSDLAAAAELGRDRDARKMAPGRVRIPDLTARPDEIGRLSIAMRGMVAALYDRIEANEQFAADVAHEIKNPLASLRSAVGTLRVAKRDDQRERLLEVIEHDVRRLDRLVSDISNASRLDSELVKEEEEPFDLTRTVRNLAEYLGKQAGEKGVEFITDLPPEPIVIQGLEARLAQVFVNLITNATSFCEEGDAVRVWVRKRDNRVLVVVEDTGPGIPEEALQKVFKRFYSERPQGDFGNHSGLGLAISKQIVEAHGGVIWAENIRPTTADPLSDPLGARFVVGLPV